VVSDLNPGVLGDARCDERIAAGVHDRAAIARDREVRWGVVSLATVYRLRLDGVVVPEPLA